MNANSPGSLFRTALTRAKPLQIVGVINAYCALMAQKIGHQALYLSGAGVANASYGLPDLGMTGLADVLEDARRIGSASHLPLLVDIDTGWGSAFSIARAVREMIGAGVAAVHIEDQAEQKRCGHRPNKMLVNAREMADRIKAAVDARFDPEFFIIARTDAYAKEGMEATLERVITYTEAGADAIFAEAMHGPDDYRTLKQGLSKAGMDVPLLANMTEFGVTPLAHRDALAAAGVDMVLYPLSAFRAMSKAAEELYRVLLSEGDQKSLLPKMQTREELYEYLNYHSYEQKLDSLFARDEKAD